MLFRNTFFSPRFVLVFPLKSHQKDRRITTDHIMLHLGGSAIEAFFPVINTLNTGATDWPHSRGKGKCGIRGAQSVHMCVYEICSKMQKCPGFLATTSKLLCFRDNRKRHFSVHFCS